MSRLYVRIYLAVLGSLLVFAVLAGLAAVTGRLFDDDDYRRGFPERGAEIAERLLPPGASAETLEDELEFWQERTGFSLLLIAPDGRTIAESGAFPQGFRSEGLAGRGRTFWRGRGGVYGLTLTDGRRLIAVPPDFGSRPFRHFGWLAGLLGIGLAIGIAFYPLVRYLTRRLECLEEGVAAFGAGDLSVRVDIPGRDEIARLAKTFNATADRIEALMTANKTLLANASHELRSPLSRLRMALERLPASGANPAVSGEIARNIEELDALIGEILLASRIQADNAGTFIEEPVDLAGVLAEECAAFGIEADVPGGMDIFVRGDARLLRRLFRNLLENAARYGGGELAEVTAGLDGATAWVTVCDRGPGIPGDEREKIFEPFYRLKNAPESAGGAGLGLALVRQIAERHGGTVRCLAREGGGSCFEIRLPSGHSASAGVAAGAQA